MYACIVCAAPPHPSIGSPRICQSVSSAVSPSVCQHAQQPNQRRRTDCHAVGIGIAGGLRIHLNQRRGVATHQLGLFDELGIAVDLDLQPVAVHIAVVAPFLVHLVHERLTHRRARPLLQTPGQRLLVGMRTHMDLALVAAVRMIMIFGDGEGRCGIDGLAIQKEWLPLHAVKGGGDGDLARGEVDVDEWAVEAEAVAARLAGVLMLMPLMALLFFLMLLMLMLFVLVLVVMILLH
mmetsp:Transcript_21438/g.52455  ORF Transcript_21438/g.52455 Transcript_21438/m.52455 type:complete len:236 (+) Transcript_21438:1466-2173(+)